MTKQMTFSEWLSANNITDKQRYRKCKKCRGTGLTGRERSQCHECGGLGRHDVARTQYMEERERDKQRWECWHHPSPASVDLVDADL